MKAKKQIKPPRELASYQHFDTSTETANYTPLFPNFNKMVKAFLAERGKTMNELADYLNMTRQGLYNHLNTNNPNIFIVRLIAEFLETSVNEVLGDLSFEGGGSIYTSPEFYNLKNRIRFYAHKQGLTLNDIANSLNAQYNDPLDENKLEEILEELESFEHKNDPENYISYIIFINNVLIILEVDFFDFFHIDRGNAEPAIVKAIGVVESQKVILEDLSLTVSFLLKSVHKEVNSRVEVMTEIIDYFLEKYPKDEVSECLISLDAYDVISKSAKRYAELKKAMKIGLKQRVKN